MEKLNKEHKPHCLILPYPLQGHINPMLQFSKRLAHKGIRTTLVTTKYLYKVLQESLGSIPVETISDGYDNGGVVEAGSTEACIEKFREVGPKTLTELIEKLNNSSDTAVDCIIYDPFFPWDLDVSKKFGLVGAAFLTQSCAVDLIFYYVYKGEIKLPITENEIKVLGLPVLESSDMPSFIYDYGSYATAFEVVLNQFQNVEKADWVLVNTFNKLEQEVIDWMENFWRVKAIGPTIPSMYLDKRLLNDKEYGFSILKPDTDACKKWLDERQNHSVIYVSFGSLVRLEVEQMEELANGLIMSNKCFLWVVRESEESKLPKNFANETSKKGLIVSWCPQLEVLAHDSVGCFITHCGWNSTLEALSLGVPMVAMPCWSDQSTNAKFVSDIWKTGIRTRADDKEIARDTEIMRCVELVMDGDEGKEIRSNAIKWKEMAREAVDEGGSSDRNIEEFVSALVNPINHSIALCSLKFGTSD
ncbi:UDP-glycosyltransferase 74G1-like [Olea europaea var. sylvestris]|uniref:UDP-glycosyltransferase 74G1-like n=1 Tax=Olea europaea var. sylvestris TaxID=158386 RepID=UPI000C1CCEBD|nr:UDP-glycosyltransferase 74G1-like [Olea europaea var. sylvestris]